MCLGQWGTMKEGGVHPGLFPWHPSPTWPPPQLVAGIKYYLTVEMESTACRKTRVSGDHVDLTTCPLATGVQQEVTALPKARTLHRT